MSFGASGGLRNITIQARCQFALRAASPPLVETWFAAHQRPLPWRAAYDPYHVWVSEVMLQQTRMEVVLRYYEQFLERFPESCVSGKRLRR